MGEFNGRLSAVDIVKIIKAASQSGIREFKCGELEFSFSATDNVKGTEHNLTQPVYHVEPSSGEETTEVTPEMEAEINEIRLDELLISDPLAHEEFTQRMLNGEGIQ